MGNFITIKVSADYALFPNSKFNYLHTYPWITPAAAVTLLESIYWHDKPYKIQYKINNVKILSPIDMTTVEIHGKRSIALKNPVYIINAEMCLTKNGVRMYDEKYEKKTYAIFANRIRKNKFFKTPYLGVSYPETKATVELCANDSLNIGFYDNKGSVWKMDSMFYGVKYENDFNDGCKDRRIINCKSMMYRGTVSYVPYNLTGTGENIAPKPQRLNC